MRKKGTLSVSLVLILSASLAVSEPLTVPYDPEYPPMSARSEDGPVGFDIEVAKEIARELGAEVDFVASNFEAIQGDAWPDEWDFTVSSTSRSDEREERFHFIGPYYFAAVVLVRLEGASEQVDPQNPFQLPEGARVGVCGGCIYREFIEGNYLTDGAEAEPPLGDVEPITFSFETDILRALVGDGDVAIDFAITSAAFAQHFRNLGFPLEQVGPPLFVEPLWITQPLSSGDDERDALRDAFVRVSGAGLVSQASRDLLGGDFSAPID